MNVLNNQDDLKIKTIFHLSDIHIRLYHRLDDEYEYVFRQMYRVLEETKKNTDDMCLIVITGDILHNKIDLSPECILTTLKFLNTLSSYYPTLFIAGNHDTLLNNKGRIDSLSAIISENQNKNLFYLKYSGWYRFGDIVFSVSSLLDDTIILSKDAPKEAKPLKKIALYHGGVGKFSTNKGFMMEGVPLKTFDGYDIVMLGDIHLYQYLDKEKRIAYAGSMIAQNFGETDIHHGVLKWDIDTNGSSFIILENPYRYCEGVLKDNFLLIDNKKEDIHTICLPEKCRLKVLVEEKTAKEIYGIKVLKDRHPHAHIYENVIVKIDPENNNGKMTTTTYPPHNHTNNPYNIIQEYFSTLPDDFGDKQYVMDLIINYFKENLQMKMGVSSHYEILELRFDYMFGYGPGVYIDFSKFQFHQTIGVFGRNSAGKSTLIEVLLFLLYGCITRYKHGQTVPNEVVHFQQKKSSGMVRFKSHNIVYEIHKTMTRSKNKIKVDEKLFKISGDGSKQDLSEEHRKKTDKFVISQIGTPSQFLFTNVFLQTNENSFRSMTPKERKDFLYDTLELSQFEDYYQVSHTKWKENKLSMTQLEKELQSLPIHHHQIISSGNFLTDLKTKEKKQTENLELLQKDIRARISQKKYCPVSSQKELLLEEQELEQNIEKLTQMNMSFKNQLSSLEQQTQNFQPDIIESMRNELWQVIENLYKKIKVCPEVEIEEERYLIYPLRPRQQDTTELRQETMDLFYTEYNRIIETKTETIEGLNEEKETLLSSLHQRKDNKEEDNQGLMERLKILEKKIQTYKSIETKLSKWKQEYSQLETQKEQLEMKWQTKWDEWECLKQQDTTLQFISTLTFKKQCGSCSNNQSILQEYIQEAETLEKKKKDLWDEIHPSKNEYDCLLENLLSLKKNIKEGIQKQETLNCLLEEKNTIQEILHNRSTHQRIQEINTLLATNHKIVKEKEEYIQMKKLWGRVEKIYTERKDILEKNKKIEDKISKKKEKLSVLDQQRKLLDETHKLRVRLDQSSMDQKKQQTRLDELKEWKDNFEYNQGIEEWVVEKEKEEQTLKERIDEIRVAFHKTQQELELMKQQEAWRQEKECRYNEYKKENDFLEKLLKVIHRDCLPMYFLEKYLPHIESRINELIAPFLQDKKILLKKEQKKESVNILLTVLTMGSETVYLGGMEGFIVDASIKEVLAEISLQCKSNLFIIDEGISALDKKHMENLDQFFHFLEERHSHVFVVSHLNEVQYIVRHSMEITKDNDGYSRIDYR